jgi:hypothetical protein
VRLAARWRRIRHIQSTLTVGQLPASVVNFPLRVALRTRPHAEKQTFGRVGEQRTSQLRPACVGEAVPFDNFASGGKADLVGLPTDDCLACAPLIAAPGISRHDLSMGKSSFYLGALAAAAALTICGCSKRASLAEKLPVPATATIITWLRDPPAPIKGFWTEDGESDAPELRLWMTEDGKTYRPGLPRSLAFDLSCEPWAHGLAFSSAALALGFGPPPKHQPGPVFSLDMGGLNLVGPVHPRAFGWTDLSVPGTFASATDGDLNRLAEAKTVVVMWGERRGVFPAPPQLLVSDFIDRCGRALRFGSWRQN